jgi:hypothetical protein
MEQSKAAGCLTIRFTGRRGLSAGFPMEATGVDVLME